LSISGTDYLAVLYSDGQDGSGHGIYAQLFDTNGNPIGQEFRVNSFTQGDQRYPSVSSSGTDFLVAWESDEKENQFDIYVTVIKDISLAITEHPASQTVDINEMAQFSVTAYTRHGNLHYEWYVNDIVRGTDSDTLSLSHVQMTDNDAAIYCIVSDDRNSLQSQTATLTVLPPITITQHPAPQTTYIGEPAVFTILAESEAPLHYQWYQTKNSTDIPVGTDSNTVTFTDPQSDDNHTLFYCEVSNYAYTELSNTAGLTVQEPAFIVTIAGDDTVTEHTTAQYTAYADYGGGNVYDVTTHTNWSVIPSGFADITSTGLLSTYTLSEDQQITIHAVYNNGSETHWADFPVLIDNVFQVVDMGPIPLQPDEVLTASTENILIRCNEAIKPSSVTTSTCQLSEPGNDGEFGTGDDTLIPLTASAIGSINIELYLGDYLLPNNMYQVALSGVANVDGKALDGEYYGSFPSGNGTHGGDFIVQFEVSRQFLSITYNDNDTVTLTWAPFRDGIVYRIDGTNSVTSPHWGPVAPAGQWPITMTEWTGDELLGVDKKFYRAVGMFAYIQSVTPDRGDQGDVGLVVAIVGNNTQWNQSQTDVSFGFGITIETIQVNDSTHMQVTISIHGTTPTGFRDITVTTGSNVEIKENGFFVREL